LAVYLAHDPANGGSRFENRAMSGNVNPGGKSNKAGPARLQPSNPPQEPAAPTAAEDARATEGTSRRDRISYGYIVVLLPCLIYTLIQTARAIRLDYTPVPILDNWRFAAYLDDLLRFAPRHFWVQHNDHRIVFPEMVYALDFVLFRGRFLLPAAFDVACQFIQTGLLWWLLHRSALPRPFQFALGGACALFMGSVMQVEGIWGPMLLQWYLSQTVAAFCFLFLWLHARNGRLSILVISIAAAVVVTLSTGNGMVIWPVLLVMAGVVHLPKQRIAGILIAGILSVSVYFAGYKFVEEPGRGALLLHHPFYEIWFALVYLGTPLTYANVWLGGVIGLVGLLLVVFAGVLAARRCRITDPPAAVAAAAVCLYIAGSALMAAYGRAEWGDGAATALADRYISVQLTYWANLVVVVGWLAACTPRRRTLALHLATASLIAVLLVAVMGQQTDRERAFAINQASAHEAGFALLSGIGDPNVIRAIHSNPGFPLLFLAGIRQKRLSIFASGRQDWLGHPLEQLFSPGLPGLCSGALESLVPVVGGYRASGWAMDRETGKAAAEIALVDSSGTVVGLGGTRPGGYPPNLDDTGPARLDWDWVGFARTSLPSEAVRAYAVVGNGKISCNLRTAGSGVASPGSAPPDQNDGKAGAVFGDEISLAGYTIRDRGGHTEVELRWSALRNPSADYSVFVHMLDADGRISFQADHNLKNGAGGTASTWVVGAPVVDRFFVTPPPSRSPGVYSLRIGVYIPSPMRILSMAGTAIPGTSAGDWKDRSITIKDVACR
jgi:hypothetical protein